MYEIEAIAKGLHIALPSNIVEEAFVKAKEFPFQTKTSLQRDIEHKGRVNEADLFGGTLIRYGSLLNITTPNTRANYEKILTKF